MRIAMVSEHASPIASLGGVDAGGQNVHVAALSTALAQRGHQVVVYTRADQEGLPARTVFAPGVQVQHLVAGPVAPVPKDDLLPHMGELAGQLRRRWQVRPPDLVHAHFWMSGLAATQALDGIHIPLVQTFHALGVVKRRWQGSADTSPGDRIEAERGLALSVDRIIATCRDEVSELRAMGAGDATMDVVPCGVDLDLFQPAADAPERPRRRPRLLILGRLVPRKGIEDAIRAMPAIPATELVIAGGPAAGELGSDPEVIRLTSIAQQLGVGDRVSFIGRVDRPALPELIRSSDLVLAVPWYEPFGIVPLEAMACGVPVVATKVGGLQDTVVSGVTGLLVPERDPAGIASAVNALLGDPAKRKSMGVAGLRRAQVRYGWDSIARLTEASYERAIEACSVSVPARLAR